MFGKAGNFYYNIVRGIDNREVNPSRERKSVGAEITFASDLINQKELMLKLHHVSERLFERIEKNKFYGKTITAKIKFHDFRQITRSRTLSKPISTYQQIISYGEQLIFSDAEITGKPIRLLGISVSNFSASSKETDNQLELDFG